LSLDPTMHNSTSNSDDHNIQLQKILVSATLSLEADKLHDWNLRSPCLYRATPKRVIDKTPTQENGQTEETTTKKLYNVPTSDVGRLTLPEGLTQELVSSAIIQTIFVYFRKSVTCNSSLYLFTATWQRIRIGAKCLCL
jgi:hypothetical protein